MLERWLDRGLQFLSGNFKNFVPKIFVPIFFVQSNRFSKIFGTFDTGFSVIRHQSGCVLRPTWWPFPGGSMHAIIEGGLHPQTYVSSSSSQTELTGRKPELPPPLLVICLVYLARSWWRAAAAAAAPITNCVSTFGHISYDQFYGPTSVRPFARLLDCLSVFLSVCYPIIFSYNGVFF